MSLPLVAELGTERRVDAERRIRAQRSWSETIDVAPGLSTPGESDVRHALDAFPWPDVEGRRCLTVGSPDGLFAFELERRGAAEVVAIGGVASGASDDGSRTGFGVIADIVGSRAERLPLSADELDPAVVGTFDVVVAVDLVARLRQPVRAFESIRTVCGGWLLSVEPIELTTSLLVPLRPVFRLDGMDEQRWWSPNATGVERLLWAAGFSVARTGPFAVTHTTTRVPGVAVPSLRGMGRAMLQRRLTGDPEPGALTRSFLALPRF